MTTRAAIETKLKELTPGPDTLGDAVRMLLEMVTDIGATRPSYEWVKERLAALETWQAVASADVDDYAERLAALEKTSEDRLVADRLPARCGVGEAKTNGGLVDSRQAEAPNEPGISSAAPDLAAMAKDIADEMPRSASWSEGETLLAERIISEILRENARRPAPATGARDDAWWLASAQSLVLACWLDLGTEKREKIAWWLRATFGQDPAPTPAFECRRCLDRLADSFANTNDPLPQCNGCFATLDPNNYAVADGCPCNSRRGINHGLVARDVCTCDVCDPSHDGCSRVKRLASVCPAPAPAPALDVEEIVRAIQDRHYGPENHLNEMDRNARSCLGDTIRAVLRERGGR